MMANKKTTMLGVLSSGDPKTIGRKAHREAMTHYGHDLQGLLVRVGPSRECGGPKKKIEVPILGAPLFSYEKNARVLMKRIVETFLAN